MGLTAELTAHAILEHAIEFVKTLPTNGLNRDLDAIEVFSGQGELSRALTGNGFNVKTFDKKNSAAEDIFTLAGTLHLAELVYRIRPGVL
eukprot:9503933-Pyramimonas_sp.AAC.1